MFAALKTLTAIFCLPLISVSCYSYRQLRQQDITPGQANDQRIAPQKVYVVNAAALPNEYRILKKSGLTHSLPTAALTIDRRVWFWGIFSFKKSRRNALAKNLYNIAKN